jgi:hypothetical protein
MACDSLQEKGSTHRLLQPIDKAIMGSRTSEQIKPVFLITIEHFMIFILINQCHIGVPGLVKKCRQQE